ncbi:DUF2062 domain-containing protein [Pseudooceanicola marinus]|uniref:DUF2062 domain-containing protein n=1 Tax=Pseudooceanicola marinus TaxID=396013 RepID=UPI001C954378|nr:DUF2062 domain-containing protein [Pseudooceanicola marinus]MBY5972529.1 DUF2062 domain-containing protein [Ferrimonas balearica]MCA1335674.1 DUF2062 domain-containing protein [Pseudooceanicola marinus]
MVFKRRDRRPYWKIAFEFFWPRGGWTRAFHYVKHRLRRLPDTPEKIARGIFAGIFTVFTPFYGMHFVVAALLAVILRGNVLAALLATFVGNPLTFVPIGVVSLQTGYWLLGMRNGPGPAPHPDGITHGFGGKFVAAADDLKDNLWALFTDVDANWQGLAAFYHEIFFPYMVGGLIPGVIAGLIGYWISVPLIRAYQARRKGALKAKLAAMRAKSAAKSAKPKR